MDVEVRFRHPDARLLHDTGHGVVGTYNEVASGNWGAVADLCAHPNAGEKIIDLNHARHVLNDAAQGTGYAFHRPEKFADLATGGMDGDDYVIRTKRQGYALEPLDLFMRLLCGQWDQADMLARLSVPTLAGVNPVDLNILRAHLTRHPEWGDNRRLHANEFPEHPHASIGIAESSPAARLAYHAYKMLGGGTPGSPTFSLPHGPLVVEVDGTAINSSRAY